MQYHMNEPAPVRGLVHVVLDRSFRAACEFRGQSRALAGFERRRWHRKGAGSVELQLDAAGQTTVEDSIDGRPYNKEPSFHVLDQVAAW